MNDLCKLFLLFMIYSIIGWIIEIIPKSIQSKRFINRGFLIGPYLPIYGSGAIIMTLLLNDFSDKSIILFVSSLIICSFLEYMTSYLMEKIFKARWWDYSNRLFNLNGRIWIGNAILFGLCGVLVLKIGNPIFLKYINKIDDTILFLVTIVLFITFIIDVIISYNIINNVKKEVVFKLEDSSERMTKKVMSVLNNRVKEESDVLLNKILELYRQISEELKKAFEIRTILYRRLINAFPGFKIGKQIIKKNIEDIKSRIKDKTKM